jgi:hypothetical protein
MPETTVLKQEVHSLNDKLQAVLGYLELGQPEKALTSTKAAAALVRQIGTEIQSRSLLAIEEAKEVEHILTEIIVRIRRLGTEVTELQQLGSRVADHHAHRKAS